MNVKKILLMTLIGAPVVNVEINNQAVGMEKIDFDTTIKDIKNTESIFNRCDAFNDFFTRCMGCYFYKKIIKGVNKNTEILSVFYNGKGVLNKRIGTGSWGILTHIEQLGKLLSEMPYSGKDFNTNNITEKTEKLVSEIDKVFDKLYEFDLDDTIDNQVKNGINLVGYLIHGSTDWELFYDKHCSIKNENWIKKEVFNSKCKKEFDKIKSRYFAPKRKLADAVANAVDSEKMFSFVNDDSEILNGNQILKQIKFLCEKNDESLDKNAHVLSFEKALRLPVGDRKYSLLFDLSALFKPTKELRINDADFGVNNKGVFSPHTESDKQKQLWKIIASKLLSEIDSVVTAYGEETLFDHDKTIKIEDFIDEFDYDEYTDIDKIFAVYCDIYNDKNRANLKVRHLAREFDVLSEEKKTGILNCAVNFGAADKRNEIFEKIYNSIASLGLFNDVTEMAKYKISAEKWMKDFVKDTEDEGSKFDTSVDFFSYLPNDENTKKMVSEYEKVATSFRLSSEPELYQLLLKVPVVVSDDDSFLDNKNWKTEQFKMLKTSYLKNLVSSWSAFITEYPKQKIGIGESLGEVLFDLKQCKKTADSLELSPENKIFPMEVYDEVIKQKIDEHGIARHNVVTEFNKKYSDAISTKDNLKKSGTYSLGYLSYVLKQGDIIKYLTSIGEKISKQRGDKNAEINEGISDLLSGKEFVEFFLAQNFNAILKKCFSDVIAKSDAEAIANDNGASLIDALATAFNAKNSALKTLDIQSKKIKGEEFVKQILGMKNEYSVDKMFNQCIDYAKEENKDKILKKYKSASKMPQKEKDELFNLINETSGRVSYTTLNKYHFEKNNLDDLKKEFSESYIKELDAKLDAYGEENDIFVGNSTIQTILSNKVAFPEDIYGKENVTLEKLFNEASDKSKNIFSSEVWNAALKKTVTQCNQWKRKNISANLLMDTVSQSVKNEVDGKVYFVDDLFKTIPSLVEICFEGISEKNKGLKVNVNDIRSNQALLRKINRQYIVMQSGDNGWEQFRSQVIDKISPDDFNFRVKTLLDVASEGVTKDYADIKNKDEFIAAVNKKVWDRIQKSSKLPGTSSCGTLKERISNCFTLSQEIYLTGDEINEESVDKGLVKAIDFVVDDWENEIPAELSKTENQT
ncbi:MAG: hypothetical protein IJ599_01615, partial [Alphaproteobacteria bacterium]|nr:hypothetical protein [Alphaproteobacteria bacterium]